MMLWSILIAAIPERYHSAQTLLHSLLEVQSVSRMADVELIYLMDNRRRSVGAKRNDLLRMAQGKYVSFIDDDDQVASDYVSKIYRQIVKTRQSEGPCADVICFPQRATLRPSGVVHECSYSISHWKGDPEKRRTIRQTDVPNVLAWTGPPAHTMCWRRAIAEASRFPDKQFGEDAHWVDQVCELATTEIVLVGEPLYFYNFDEATSSTRGR